jgi:tetratricopeptide (TPR) repeat protein
MRIFACGRLIVTPRRSAERALKRAGGILVKRMQDADLAVIGGGAVAWPEEKLTATIENAGRLRLPVLSERGFLRRIEMLPPLPEEARPYTIEDLSKRARIPAERLRRLILFDIIEGEEERFGFRAMKAAKAAAALIEKVSLADLAAACHRVRSAFNVAEPLSELQLAAENNRIVLSAGGRLADLDGQLRLELYLPGPDVEALLGSADEAREAGENEVAERQLRQALVVSPRDTDVLFELGSLLSEGAQFAEGVALLQKATRLRPDFADAWYNIGHAFERQGRSDEALRAYSQAVDADPFYADPLYNLGMLCLEDGKYAEAIGRLEAYLAIDARSGWAETARKAVTLARMSMTHAAAG